MNSADLTKPLRTVLLAAIEPSTGSEHVIHTATFLARTVPGAELHLLYVLDAATPRDPGRSLTQLVHEGRRYLERAVREVCETSASKVAAHLEIGTPVDRILQMAVDLSADLVIVGTHGKKHVERALGSVSEKVLIDASCAVLVARPKGERADIPHVEPPCPDCTELQRTTRGKNLWCGRHAQRHVHDPCIVASPRVSHANRP